MNFYRLQKSITKIQSTSNQWLCQKIRQNAIRLHESSRKLHLHWISDHSDIASNILTNRVVKSELNQFSVENVWISFNSISNQIDNYINDLWLTHSRQTKKDRYYSKFNLKSDDFSIKIKNADKLIFSTLMKMKTRHDYFKSYLYRLPEYESQKCNDSCRCRQNSEHLLINCIHYREKQYQL